MPHYPSPHVCIWSSFSHVWLFCDPMDCNPPRSSVHGIFQARTPEWVAISFSRGSSRPRKQTHVSYVSWIGGRSFTTHKCHLVNLPFPTVQKFNMVSPTHLTKYRWKKERMQEVGQKDRCLWCRRLQSWLSIKLDQLVNLLIVPYVMSPNLHRVETTELLVVTFKPERQHTMGCSPRGIFMPSSWPLFSKLSSIPSWFLRQKRRILSHMVYLWFSTVFPFIISLPFCWG